MRPSRCPICAEPGGFHDRERHAQIQRTLASLRIAVRSPAQWGGMIEVRSAALNDLGKDGRAAGMLSALEREVGTGPALDDLLESLGQMARGEGRVVREGVDDVPLDRR
jgi:hypothetical protein